MPADSKPVTHDEVIEDGLFDDPKQGALELTEIIDALEESFISCGKAALESVKTMNPNPSSVAEYKELQAQLSTLDEVKKASIKTDILKAQSEKALADARMSNAKATSAEIKLEQQSTAIQQKKIVLTNQEIAQKQINAQKDRDAIALIKAQLLANDQTIGSLQRVQAQSTALRLERAKLNTGDANYRVRLTEINKELDSNNEFIRKNSDVMKRQALNVGNYAESFKHSLRPIEELVRGISYAMGVPIEGLREYTGVIRGLTHFVVENKEETKEAAGETEFLAEVQGEAAVTAEAETAAQAASIPILGWVVAGTIALAAGIAIAIEATEAHKKAIDARSIAVDGSIIRDKKQRDDWNEYLVTMKKLENEYQVLIGNMGDYEAAMDELEENASVKVRDLKNEMVDNIRVQTTWFGSIHGFFNNIADVFDDDVISDRIKQLTDQYTGAAGVITRITNELAEQEKIAAKKRDDDVIKSNFDLLDSEIDNAEKIADVKNEAIRNDYERNKQSLADEKEFSKQKIQNKIAEQEALNKANQEDITGLTGQLQTKRAYKYTTESQSHFDADNAGVDKANADVQKKIDNIKAQNTIIANEHQKLVDELSTIDTVSDNKNKKLDAENVRAHTKQMLEELDEAAKLSKDKDKIAQADYVKQKNELHESEEYIASTAEEKILSDENLDKQHNEVLYQNARIREKAEMDLLKNHTALILDAYVKEVETAKDKYNDELFVYQGMLHNKDISLEQYNQYQIDSENTLNEALYQADLKDNERRKAAGLKHTENQADATLKETSLHKSTPKQIYEAKSADNTAHENMDLFPSEEAETEAKHKIDAAGKDEENASNPEQVNNDEKAIAEGTKDLQEAQDNQADIKKVFQDNQKKLDEDYHNQQIDEVEKTEKELTNAVAEGLQKRSEMQQASDQENIDIHSRLMGVQATLAAGGRANSLAAETADMEKAEEQKKQDAIKAAKVQQGIQLAQTFLSLVAAFARQGNTTPEIKAMAETMAAKGLAASISGYATGVEGLEGPGTGTSDDILIRTSKGESVVTAKGTEQTPGLVTAINKDGLIGAMDWANIYIPQFKAANSTVVTAPFNNHDELAKVFERQTEKIIQAYESKPVQSVNLGRIGEWHETVIRDSNRVTIHHLQSRKKI